MSAAPSTPHARGGTRHRGHEIGDRKSTRLNSRHSQISYADFCLTKQGKSLQRRPGYPHIGRNMQLAAEVFGNLADRRVLWSLIIDGLSRSTWRVQPVVEEIDTRT